MDTTEETEKLKPKRTYVVVIRGTVKKTIEVEAENEADAREQAESAFSYDEVPGQEEEVVEETLSCELK